jgi:hypothetical protein
VSTTQLLLTIGLLTALLGGVMGYVGGRVAATAECGDYLALAEMEEATITLLVDEVTRLKRLLYSPYNKHHKERKIMEVRWKSKT